MGNKSGFDGFTRDLVAKDKILIGDTVKASELYCTFFICDGAVGDDMAGAGYLFYSYAGIDIDCKGDIVSASLPGFEVLHFGFLAGNSLFALCNGTDSIGASTVAI